MRRECFGWTIFALSIYVAVWDEAGAREAVAEAFRALADNAAPEGFQLADEREAMLWGVVNMLDAQVRRLDRGVDGLAPSCATCSGSRTAPRSTPANSNSRPTGPRTSASGATRSRKCATPPPTPTPTATPPATPGDRDTEPRQPDRQAHLGGHRRPRGPRDRRAPARRHPDRGGRRQGRH